METSLLSTRETSVPVICLEIEHPAVGAGETSGLGQTLGLVRGLFWANKNLTKSHKDQRKVWRLERAVQAAAQAGSPGRVSSARGPGGQAAQRVTSGCWGHRATGLHQQGHL